MLVKNHQFFLLAFMAVALAGCVSHSDVQSKYIAQQNECRASALALDAAAGDPLQAIAAEEINSTIAKQFSECMNKAGWHVAAPKLPAPAPPAAAPPAKAAAAPAAPVATTPTAATPTAAMPPLNPPVPAQGATTYPLARPEGAAEVPYGTGAGRQF